MHQALTYDSLEDQAILYDHVDAYTERPDVAFYVEEARRAKGPVLELACGTGRVLIPIARDGQQIVGIDRSTQMLDRCRDQRRRVDLLRDARGWIRRTPRARLLDAVVSSLRARALLARAGFEIRALYGDFTRAPLVDSSPEIIVIARAH